MAPRILVMDNPLNSMEVARELAPPGFEVVTASLNSPDFKAALPGTDYIIGLGDPSMDDSFYQAAPRLKLLQLVSAGYDRCDIGAARRAGVPICNNGGANAVAVAEHALLLMLAVSRRLVWQHTSTASRRWRGNNIADVKLFELYGRTLGIIGLGSIGKKVARLGSAFGMQVIYYDTTRLTEDQADALNVRFRLMEEVLRSADLVSLHVPLTPATKHLIGAPELALMKPTSYLINTCRGPVVDEAALYAALSEGRIAGAGLDVFDQEPPPADNRLFALDNVILTPHMAGPTWDTQYTRYRNGYDNVQRVARGDTPLWIIPELRSA
jgi:phosphoglycerate dehydrogenase-like enzyme